VGVDFLELEACTTTCYHCCEFGSHKHIWPTLIRLPSILLSRSFPVSSPFPSTPSSQPQSLRISLNRYPKDLPLIFSHHTFASASASGFQIPRNLDLLRSWYPDYLSVKAPRGACPSINTSPHLNPSQSISRILCAQIPFVSNPQTLPIFPLASSTPKQVFTMAPEPKEMTDAEADRLNALQMVRTSLYLIISVSLA
jgi:hypothetical protein